MDDELDWESSSSELVNVDVLSVLLFSGVLDLPAGRFFFFSTW